MEVENTELKNLQTLYSLSSKGKLHEWTIKVRGDSLFTEHGYVGGKLVVTLPYRATAKNIGRSNETTPHEQACAEALSVWNKRVEQGGVVDASLAKHEAPYLEPMLAKNWKDIKQAEIRKQFPVYAQAKFDGMRCIISEESGATSRGGKSWNTIPHIVKMLQPLFDAYPGIILDGELYNHLYHDDFDKISSLIKRGSAKSPVSLDNLEKSAKLVKFYWYDIADSSMPFGQRTALLKELHEKFFENDNVIVRVHTYLANNEEELDTLFEEWLEDGYEGQMVRLDLPYEFGKRSQSLIKRKTTIDEEFEIGEIVEGEGNRINQAQRVWFIDSTGRKFKTNIKGPEKFRKELLANKDTLRGKFATVQFLNYTPKGVPRCGFLIRLRSGKGLDQ